MCRCHNCGQPLVEIDNRGERLRGCLTCNLWTAGDAKGWTRLSEEDLRALHQVATRRKSLTVTKLKREALHSMGGTGLPVPSFPPGT